MTTIGKWQEAFYSGPCVWATMVEGEVCHLYESEQGAQLEADWHNKRHPAPRRSQHRMSIVRFYVHTDELSHQRWVEGFTRKEATP